MVELKGTKADNITNALKDILVRLQLPLADCRGQCYDGASVMAGVKSGVAVQIKKVTIMPNYGA